MIFIRARPGQADRRGIPHWLQVWVVVVVVGLALGMLTF